MAAPLLGSDGVRGRIWRIAATAASGDHLISGATVASGSRPCSIANSAAPARVETAALL
jgi:hypothetical protein